MSPVDRLLGRLQGLKRTGPDRWIGLCPAHHDKRPSLSVRDLGDRVLVHCFGGCDVADVVAAVGLEMTDLFERNGDYSDRHRERRPWPASDVLRAVAFEATVAAIGAAAVAGGRGVTQADLARLVLAASRLRAAARIAGVSHD